MKGPKLVQHDVKRGHTIVGDILEGDAPGSQVPDLIKSLTSEDVAKDFVAGKAAVPPTLGGALMSAAKSAVQAVKESVSSHSHVHAAGNA